MGVRTVVSITYTEKVKALPCQLTFQYLDPPTYKSMSEGVQAVSRAANPEKTAPDPTTYHRSLLAHRRNGQQSLAQVDDAEQRCG